MFRLIIALFMAIASLFSYFGARAPNPVTGETQRINISPEQEVALGQRAAPELAQRYGGLAPDESAQQRVDRIGQQLAQGIEEAAPYPYEFHLLPTTTRSTPLPYRAGKSS